HGRFQPLSAPGRCAHFTVPTKFTQAVPRESHRATRGSSGRFRSATIRRGSTIIDLSQAVLLVPLDAWFADDMVAEHDRIHVGAHETFERLGGCADDGLVTHIEGGVQHDWHAGNASEGLDESIEARVRVFGYGLDARRSVDVRHGGNDS